MEWSRDQNEYECSGLFFTATSDEGEVNKQRDNNVLILLRLTTGTGLKLSLKRLKSSLKVLTGSLPDNRDENDEA